MIDDKPAVIRIVKRRANHDEHHGGSWKVAYADFVTAMMAFFLVMWVVGMNQEAKDSVQSYFNNPMGFSATGGAGGNPMFDGSTPTGMQMSLNAQRNARDRQREALERVGKGIRAKLDESVTSQELNEQVKVLVTEDGLRIELTETDAGETFFSLSSAELKPATDEVLRIIAPELTELDNPVIVEGHTDSRPLNQVAYTNWELSNERANAARRALELAGLDPARIVEVRGYADRKLAVPDRPFDAANRRVSIYLPFSETSISVLPDTVLRPITVQ